MIIRENAELAPFTYYKIGGPARYFAQPESVEDLADVAALLRQKKLGYFILGAGSNVLFDDQGFDGLVLHTAKLDTTLIQHGDRLEVGASVMNIQLLRHCMNVGLAGMEFLAGVPGNIGGALFMNAGTKLGEAAAVVQSMMTFDLATSQLRRIGADELNYEYRTQKFLGPHEVILRGILRGKPTEPKIVQEQIQNVLETRRKTQPVDKPSCGSVFKNPDAEKGLFAGKLIEEAGLRGLQQGKAQISPMHCNFIVNLGGAKAADVKHLINEAKRRVRERTGIELEEEVRIVGFTPVNRL